MKYTRQKKFLVGTGYANRDHKEIENMLGMFVNTVLLHSDLSGNPTFIEFLKTTRQEMLEDSRHYDIPFMSIVERMKAGNTPGRNPLFQALFAFHDSPVPVMEFAGLKGTIMERHNSSAKTDMNVICIPRAEQHIADKEAAIQNEDITVLWEYNTDLFERETMQRMFEHYINLLKYIIEYPDLHVNDMEIMTSVERDKILYDFNGTRADYDKNKTMVQMFKEQVRKHPDKIAVIHNNKTISYKELDQKSNKLANRLIKT
jgi:non-ribosomal peptide synthetase component F